MFDFTYLYSRIFVPLPYYSRNVNVIIDPVTYCTWLENLKFTPRSRDSPTDATLPLKCSQPPSYIYTFKLKRVPLKKTGYVRVGFAILRVPYKGIKKKRFLDTQIYLLCKIFMTLTLIFIFIICCGSGNRDTPSVKISTQASSY